jgi:hypothetical protein
VSHASSKYRLARSQVLTKVIKIASNNTEIFADERTILAQAKLEYHVVMSYDGWLWSQTCTKEKGLHNANQSIDRVLT